MSDENKGSIRRRREEFFSARYFFIRALVLVGLFLVAHALGLREYTTFLSGTTDDAGTAIQRSEFYGVIYVLLYLGFVVGAPILLLAAGMLKAWQRVRPNR